MASFGQKVAGGADYGAVIEDNHRARFFAHRLGKRAHFAGQAANRYADFEANGIGARRWPGILGWRAGVSGSLAVGRIFDRERHGIPVKCVSARKGFLHPQGLFIVGRK